MTKSKFGIVLPLILLSYFMILLDNSIIFTSTAKIAADLGLTTQGLSWITNAYALTFGGLLLFAGKLGDAWGRKRLFMVGLLVFSLSSLMVGGAVNGPIIIAMRAVQGIGAAILAPTTLALLMDHYTGQTRTRAIAYYGATGGLGASFGLVIGGVIASYLSWRVGFFLNGPLGLILLGLAGRYLPADASRTQGLDLVGTLLSVLGMAALVYNIDGTVYREGALVVAIGGLSGLVWHERTAASPLMPLALFKNGERAWAYLARFTYVGATLAYFFLTPLALQRVYGWTPLQAAVGFLPETLPQFLMATLLTRLALTHRNADLLLLGAGLSVGGLALTGILGLDHGYWLGIAGPMVILGIGQGLTLSPLTVAGVAQTTPAMSGAASSVVNTLHQIGGSVGLSVVVLLTSHLTAPRVAYTRAVWLMTGLAVLALLFSWGVWVASSEKKQ